MSAEDPLIPTRQSLLSRLKDWNDQESWKDFFDTYWRLIYGAATRAGLNDAEAQDVVQETVMSVLKSMPSFQYDEKGSFKSWLLRLTRWRIADQLLRREPPMVQASGKPRQSTNTATVERVADPLSVGLEVAWDRDWEANLLEVAIERIKKTADPTHYQIFDLYVFKEWPVSKVALTLRVNPAKVYMIKHRFNKLIKNEIVKLQANPMLMEQFQESKP